MNRFCAAVKRFRNREKNPAWRSIDDADAALTCLPGILFP